MQKMVPAIILKLMMIFELTLQRIFYNEKVHIVLLVFIAVSIALLISFMGNLSTYETISSAKQKEGKSVTIIAKLDNISANRI